MGHEAALFVPTGTMGNQIAIHLLARRGSDVLVEEGAHVYRYELGAMAAWSGALPRVIRGDQGRITPEQLSAAIAPSVYYMAVATLLVLENTHNHAGGAVLEPADQSALVSRAREHGLGVHLDGARIFNAALAAGVDARRLAEGPDTVMFCLSKGLGAPVGSLLCGRDELVREARVVRKRMGGGMRQAGVLAAAGLFALEHHVDRLADDHLRAARLALALAGNPLFEVDPARVRTNIVVAAVRDAGRTDALLGELRAAGVLAGTMGRGRIRFVTHLDVDDAGLDRAIAALGRLARR
jgi:threonine aldolase